MKRFVAIAAVGASLLAVSSVRAVEVESFDNFNLMAIYASWGAPFATLTSGPTGFTVTSTHYGSGYSYLGSTIDAAGTDTVVANVDVTEGVAGVIFDVSDNNGNGESFKFYGLVPGGGTDGGNNYTLTMPIGPNPDGSNYFSGTGVLDPSILTNLNIEIDPGSPGTAEYTATFNDLSFVKAPEPSGLAIGAVACLLGARRRRA